jgi:hypothetical protein
MIWLSCRDGVRLDHGAALGFDHCRWPRGDDWRDCAIGLVCRQPQRPLRGHHRSHEVPVPGRQPLPISTGARSRLGAACLHAASDSHQPEAVSLLAQAGPGRPRHRRTGHRHRAPQLAHPSGDHLGQQRRDRQLAPDRRLQRVGEDRRRLRRGLLPPDAVSMPPVSTHGRASVALAPERQEPV